LPPLNEAVLGGADRKDVLDVVRAGVVVVVVVEEEEESGGSGEM
jgi:hypothetical protein